MHVVFRLKNLHNYSKGFDTHESLARLFFFLTKETNVCDLFGFPAHQVQSGNGSSLKGICFKGKQILKVDPFRRDRGIPVASNARGPRFNPVLGMIIFFI